MTTARQPLNGAALLEAWFGWFHATVERQSFYDEQHRAVRRFHFETFDGADVHTGRPVAFQPHCFGCGRVVARVSTPTAADENAAWNSAVEDGLLCVFALDQDATQSQELVGENHETYRLPTHALVCPDCETALNRTLPPQRTREAATDALFAIATFNGASESEKRRESPSEAVAPAADDTSNEPQQYTLF